MTHTTQTIPTDDALALVADRHRRAILWSCIDNEDEPIPLETLVEDVAGEEPVQRAGFGEQLRQIRTRLHHTHLPKLAEQNVIQYDSEQRTVRYRPNKTLEDLVRFVDTTLE